MYVGVDPPTGCSLAATGKDLPMIRLARFTACACLLAVLALSGCGTWAKVQRKTVIWNYPHATGETFAQSPHEHYQWVSDMSAHDSRALVEDLDLLFLTDRPTRLTHWHGR